MRLRTTRPRIRRLGVLGALLLPALLAVPATATAAGNDHEGKPKSKPAVAQGAEAFGVNDSGQLGDGSTTDRRLTAVTVAIPDGVKAVAAGVFHGLALLNNGTVKSWGIGANGELGNGQTQDFPVPGSVADLTGVKAISAGGFFSLALLDNGTVMSFGRNNVGQLGDGTTTAQPLPVAVIGLPRKAVAISAGVDHSLALLDDGTVWAWGGNGHGQLGNGTTSNQPQATPIAVTGLTGVKVKAISAGFTFSLAALGDGSVRAWGDNDHGQLGNNSTTDSSSPVAVAGLAGVKVKAVSAGDDYSLALLTSGRVKGWGFNANGELGDGTFTSPRLTPVDTVGVTGVTALDAGFGEKFPGGQSLAVANGKLVGWGLNVLGQLGNGTLTSRNLAAPIRTGLGRPHSVAAGQLFSVVS
ncbi:RCC1 domain-containing protein [Catellatospora tritici]|uniref:RCC1 domain-containing protein n=1 Tax=Catellatospora tritici TaxID=2851566 RepID=UPI001C2CD43C|nr:cell wall anchor protein [Catellatospora tritici]MBV1853736.1 cell wall anchor protein [Catellatospora tritici]